MKQARSIWFVVGSQGLYGPEALKQVASNSQEIVAKLDLSLEVTLKPVMTDSSAIRELCLEANRDPSCAGLILWMHTFSPAKMWIAGLSQLSKPVCHLHTQFNRDLPWDSIDMDFMNLNQAAHGDREAGHLHTRLGLRREVVVGHWENPSVQARLDDWARVANGWTELRSTRVARFGDNMRHVSVTDGDKVAAEMTFGFSVDGFGVGDLVDSIASVSDKEADCQMLEYEDLYDLVPDLRRGGPRREELAAAARQELGIKKFLIERNYQAFTTTFEDLHGLPQLPGLACQRLMAEGFGFGAEGDWKTAALLRFAKVAAGGMEGGTSFMEDYTYDLGPQGGRVLGAHMLEICPSIAESRPRVEIHPLGIGGKNDPVRLVFSDTAGPAVNASLVDLGGRFRLVVNSVESQKVPEMPNLPVARSLWKCHPSFETATTCWIYAGGAHHTVYSHALNSRHFELLGEMAGVETLVIDEETTVLSFKNELRWNESAYGGRA